MSVARLFIGTSNHATSFSTNFLFTKDAKKWGDCQTEVCHKVDFILKKQQQTGE